MWACFQKENPPIMKDTSWTLASPFKEERYYRSPSDSIANNYTPTAADLKIRHLPKLKGNKPVLYSYCAAELETTCKPGWLLNIHNWLSLK